MKVKRNNGFTLVELIAVISIFGMIVVLAIPKITKTVEDFKKKTLVLTAKSIARSAEEWYIENATLDTIREMSCDEIMDYSKDDFSSCSVFFDENGSATITLIGKNKYKNLNVCGGTKASAIAIEEECNDASEKITATSYFKELLANEEKLNNGLVQTIATYNGVEYDAGIRYIGSIDEVNNKVYYNCDDTDSYGISYGETNYNYASSCEVWRIIGVFDIKTSTSGDAISRVKLININSTFKASWDSSDVTVNEGEGINQWGPSGDYEGADIMRLLNGYYIGVEGSTCTYCNELGVERCSNVCDVASLSSANMKPLTNKAKKMIENAVWDTYAVKWPSSGSAVFVWASTAYLEEKGISSKNDGKNLCVNTNGSSYIKCNDNVKRTTNWTGLVGLASVSDITYADGWLYNPKGTSLLPWTISPFVNPNCSTDGWAGGNGNAFTGTSYFTSAILASVYLKPDIQIIGGDGNIEPYKLK